MMKSQMAPLGAKSNLDSGAAGTTGVASVLEGDEIRQINLNTKREDELSEALDDSGAREEEDEEDDVEAAGEAKRS